MTTVEEPIEEDEQEGDAEEKPEKTEDDEDEGTVEEEKEEKAPKTKKVDKTTWDWELCNESKPIWTRKPADIEEGEYDEFYKSITKDKNGPLGKTHFIAEGEVTFKALLYIPSQQPSESFQQYGKKTDNIKLYVRRVFITDDFKDMMPNYLSFVKGVVDSDDLPLNVSRETLQQHKLLKVIKKQLVRKTLDMIKKLDDEQFEKFWKEYSTNIKLGVIEDSANRTRLAKILKFLSSNDAEKQTSLAEYVERMKEKQEHIYYVAGSSLKEVKASPFVERLLKKGYEVLYLTEAIDEYAINAVPEFEGKKFQNVAKEGLTIDESEGSKEYQKELEERFEPLTKWLGEDVLKEEIAKVTVSSILEDSPCALMAPRFGWSGNMERLNMAKAHQKTNDPTYSYYLSQKKTLEINPRHPLIKELLRRVQADPEDAQAKTIANMMFKTATLRSGYMLKDTVDFAKTVEEMMRTSLDIPLDEQVEEEPEIMDEPDHDEEEIDDDEDEDDAGDIEEMHDEL